MTDSHPTDAQPSASPKASECEACGDADSSYEITAHAKALHAEIAELRAALRQLIAHHNDILECGGDPSIECANADTEARRALGTLEGK